MRISGWSSDVCASDLHLAQAGREHRLDVVGVRAEDAPEQAEGQDEEHGGGDLALGGEGVDLKIDPGAGPVGLADLPIRRASCSARVCRYRSIEVVAVTSKIK